MLKVKDLQIKEFGMDIKSCYFCNRLTEAESERRWVEFCFFNTLFTFQLPILETTILVSMAQLSSCYVAVFVKYYKAAYLI